MRERIRHCADVGTGSGTDACSEGARDHSPQTNPVYWSLSEKIVYTLRADRLEIVSGLITKEFRTINIKDVQEIQTTQGLFQLLMHCGNVYCYNKGVDVPFSLIDIPDHLRWKEEIEKRIR